MVTRKLVAALAAAGLAAAAAAQHLPVHSVRVLKVGRWRADPDGLDTRAHCARFRPTDAEVRRWFRRARVVSRPEWGELVWTQCSADGTVVMRAHQYRWHLDQSGRGNISRPGREDLYLSGPELPFRPGRD